MTRSTLLVLTLVLSAAAARAEEHAVMGGVQDDKIEAEAPPAAPPPDAVALGDWKDEAVAEHAPNLYGQTGLARVTSALPGKGGLVDIGLHGRGFYLPDFIGPGADDNAFIGGLGTFGFTLFDVVELALAAQFGSNANGAADPSNALTVGDLYPSLKLGYGLFGVGAGVDVRGYLPASTTGIGPDLGNFAVSATGLLTLDLYGAWDIPVRAHLNGGYTYQHARNSGAADRYYHQGVAGHLAAFTTSTWYYDQAFYGVGLELLFPYVTVYGEAFGLAAVGVLDTAGPGGGPYGIVDTHLVVSPGLRFTILRGLHVDVGSDFGILGTGGYFTPDVSNLTDGQPLNPAYNVHLALTWTFSPFAAASAPSSSSSVVSAPPAPAAPVTSDVEGCVINARAQTPVERAFVDLGDGVVLVTSGRGCFKARAIPPGKHTITVSHPDYKTATVTVEVASSSPSRADVVLEPAPRAAGLFRGLVTDARNQPVEARVVVRGGAVGEMTVDAKEGVFHAELPAGRYHAIVDAPGHLKQGATIGVDEGGRTVRSFALKPEPKKRISKIKRDRIALTTKVPFEVAKPRLLPAAEFILEDVVDLMLRYREIGRLRVEGVPGEGAEQGDELARARAEAVIDFLISRGVPAERLEAAVAAPSPGAKKGDVELVLVDGGKS